MVRLAKFERRSSELTDRKTARQKHERPSANTQAFIWNKRSHCRFVTFKGHQQAGMA
jgi:hypothetical protein